MNATEATKSSSWVMMAAEQTALLLYSSALLARLLEVRWKVAEHIEASFSSLHSPISLWTAALFPQLPPPPLPGSLCFLFLCFINSLPLPAGLCIISRKRLTCGLAAMPRMCRSGCLKSQDYSSNPSYSPEKCNKQLGSVCVTTCLPSPCWLGSHKGCKAPVWKLHPQQFSSFLPMQRAVITFLLATVPLFYALSSRGRCSSVKAQESLASRVNHYLPLPTKQHCFCWETLKCY